MHILYSSPGPGFGTTTIPLCQLVRIGLIIPAFNNFYTSSSIKSNFFLLHFRTSWHTGLHSGSYNLILKVVVVEQPIGSSFSI